MLFSTTSDSAAAKPLVILAAAQREGPALSSIISSRAPLSRAIGLGQAGIDDEACLLSVDNEASPSPAQSAVASGL
jgi:hypothetical protein